MAVETSKRTRRISANVPGMFPDNMSVILWQVPEFSSTLITIVTTFNFIRMLHYFMTVHITGCGKIPGTIFTYITSLHAMVINIMLTELGLATKCLATCGTIIGAWSGYWPHGITRLRLVVVLFDPWFVALNAACWWLPCYRTVISGLFFCQAATFCVSLCIFYNTMICQQMTVQKRDAGEAFSTVRTFQLFFMRTLLVMDKCRIGMKLMAALVTLILVFFIMYSYTVLPETTLSLEFHMAPGTGKFFFITMT